MRPGEERESSITNRYPATNAVAVTSAYHTARMIWFWPTIMLLPANAAVKDRVKPFK